MNESVFSGEYIYFLEAFGPTHSFFGPIPAFLYSWLTIFLLKPSSLAVLSLSFAKYLTTPIFTATGFCEDPDLTYVITRLVAGLCIGKFVTYFFQTYLLIDHVDLGVITFVNCYSVTLATRVQNVFTIGKLSAMLIIIAGGLYNLSKGKHFSRLLEENVM